MIKKFIKTLVILNLIYAPLSASSDIVPVFSGEVALHEAHRPKLSMALRSGLSPQSSIEEWDKALSSVGYVSKHFHAQEMSTLPETYEDFGFWHRTKDAAAVKVWGRCDEEFETSFLHSMADLIERAGKIPLNVMQIERLKKVINPTKGKVKSITKDVRSHIDSLDEKRLCRFFMKTETSYRLDPKTTCTRYYASIKAELVMSVYDLLGTD